MSVVRSSERSSPERRVRAALPVVPRWEWRSFAPAAKAGPVEVPSSDRTELYLLSLASPHNVKVRDSVLDVKRLERIDASGLEQWRPVLKAAFPLDAGVIAVICDAWGIAAPPDIAASYSLDDLISSIVAPHGALRTVTVAKQRSPIVVAECHGERAWLSIDGQPWTTLAFEDADPMRVLGALHSLGLDAAANEDYPRALKRIRGFVRDPSDPS